MTHAKCADNFMCCDRNFPAEYRTTGVDDADFLLIVTARPTTGSVIAWALECASDEYGTCGHATQASIVPAEP